MSVHRARDKVDTIIPARAGQNDISTLAANPLEGYIPAVRAAIDIVEAVRAGRPRV